MRHGRDRRDRDAAGGAHAALPAHRHALHKQVESARRAADVLTPEQMAALIELPDVVTPDTASLVITSAGRVVYTVPVVEDGQRSLPVLPKRTTLPRPASTSRSPSRVPDGVRRFPHHHGRSRERCDDRDRRTADGGGRHPRGSPAPGSVDPGDRTALARRDPVASPHGGRRSRPMR